EILTLGTSPAGALLGNLLQILASFAGAAMCVGAARRGKGFARSFWILVGTGMAIWGISNFGWFYYEGLLQREPPELSFVRFLFDTQEALFAMALLLEWDQQSDETDFGFLLDALQIVLVFLFIYAGLFFVPSLTLDSRSALLREYIITVVEIAALLLLAVLRMILTPSLEAKRLYKGLAVYLAVYLAGAVIANGILTQHETPTGTFLDFAYTIPLLFGAFWAARWKPGSAARSDGAVKLKTLGETILTNALFGVAPVMIFLLSAG